MLVEWNENREVSIGMEDRQDQRRRVDWQEVLRESTWLTIAWEWLQTLLARAVDLVLWVTMVFSCYQLIPGAPQAPGGVSTFMFIMQFIALDIGGLSMNRLAQKQGLDRWAYARVVAYILIGITLITISYAGIQHAVSMPADVTGWIEAILVIARSIMTVLYGQAMHSLKEEEETTSRRLEELETEVPGLREQASTVQQQMSSVQSRVSTLQDELDRAGREVSSLREQLDGEKRRSAEMQRELETGHGDTAALRRDLGAATIQVETLQAQLEGKKKELAGLREILESGQDWQESRVRGVVETEQQRVAALQQQLLSEQNVAVGLRKQLNAAVLDSDGLRRQLEAKVQALESFQAGLNGEQQAVVALRQKLGDEQNVVEGLRVELGSMRVEMRALQEGLSAKGQELQRVKDSLDGEIQRVSALTQQLVTEKDRVSTLRQKLDTQRAGQVSTVQNSGQGKVDSKVLQLDTTRRRSGQDADGMLAEQIRLLLLAEPGLSGRAIAARLQCSPTTASRWKQHFEKGGQDSQDPDGIECVNE